MPPKKKPKAKQVKRRKRTQPLQKQTQKQVVNIKIGDDKKKRRRKKKSTSVAGKQAITPLAGSLGNTLNMGVYSDLSRLNTLENLINRIIPKQISQPISKPIPASVPVSTQTTMLGEKPISKSELDFISELESILEKPTAPSPAEIEQEGISEVIRRRTPTKSTPPPRNIPQPTLIRGSSISSLSASDDETIGLPRRGLEYLSSGAETQRDLQTIDEMNLSASGFGDL